MSEAEKFDLLLRAIKRGIPLDRVYRIIIRPRTRGQPRNFSGRLDS